MAQEFDGLLDVGGRTRSHRVAVSITDHSLALTCPRVAHPRHQGLFLDALGRDALIRHAGETCSLQGPGLGSYIEREFSHPEEAEGTVILPVTSLSLEVRYGGQALTVSLDGHLGGTSPTAQVKTFKASFDIPQAAIQGFLGQNDEQHRTWAERLGIPSSIDRDVPIHQCFYTSPAIISSGRHDFQLTYAASSRPLVFSGTLPSATARGSLRFPTAEAWPDWAPPWARDQRELVMARLIDFARGHQDLRWLADLPTSDAFKPTAPPLRPLSATESRALARQVGPLNAQAERFRQRLAAAPKPSKPWWARLDQIHRHRNWWVALIILAAFALGWLHQGT
ncbi:MAG: hypothetical protein EOP40_07615 [Rubrivivax sp.]|nr:MAG: hypothetical protein EOP40_07615 [Rubrivivax sp.]